MSVIKKSVLTFLLLCVQLPIFAGGGSYPPFTGNEEARYVQSLQDAVANQRKRVQDLVQAMASSDRILTAMDRVDVDHAAAVLNVKETLYGNFVGTQSLRSPLVRDRLLALLQKESISPQDLAEFQGIVTEEKAHINEQLQSDQQQQQNQQNQKNSQNSQPSWQSSQPSYQDQQWQNQQWQNQQQQQQWQNQGWQRQQQQNQQQQLQWQRQQQQRQNPR